MGSSATGAATMAAIGGDLGRPPIRADLAAGLRAAAAAGRGLATVVGEMARLALGPGRLTPEEYIYYRLFEPGLDLEAKRRFVGIRAQDGVFRRATDPSAITLAHDKLAYTAFMRGQGLPVPSIGAVCHPCRSYAGAAALRSAEELAGYLRTARPYPCFLKPVAGMFSKGTLALEGYDAAADAVLDHRGRPLAVSELAAGVDAAARDGYLVQPLLRPHPEIAELCGPRLATCRLIVALDDDGPHLLKALWKIPAGESFADNYWRTGNLLALLDRVSGEVRRVIRGGGLGLEELAAHPDTGLGLVGRRVPCWDEVLARTLQAAPCHHGLRLQAWDVAVTDAGVQLLELNIGGDVSLPQLAEGRGLMQPDLVAFLDRCDAWRRRAGIGGAAGLR